MRIRPYLLIVGLLTLLSCLPIASGQQPGTVTVRQRVATSPPGLPTVDVSVDRHRVPAGDDVTFTLSPSSVVLNPLYTITLDFGDGKSTRAQQIKIIHFYRHAGNYTYRVSVRASDKPAPQTVPSVSLSATPSSVTPNETVTFSARLSEKYPNIKYRFVFADGWVTKWQDAPETEHRYVEPKTYLAYVDIGEGVQGSVKRLGGSIRQAVQVKDSGPQRDVTVNLSAQPVRVAERQVVSFTAKVPSGGSGVRYQFDFGDKSPATNWQVSPRARHRYLVAGTYSPRVDVRAMNVAGVPTASSSPVRIEVEAAAKPDVSLSASPNSVLENMPILFRARLNSSNSNVRYRFNFGDGSKRTEWTSESVQPHVYTRQGKYAPSVEIARSNSRLMSPAASSSTQVTVDRLFRPDGPTPTPTPTPRPTSTSTPTPTPRPTSTSTPTPTPRPTPTSTPTPTPSPSPSPTVDRSSPSPSSSASPVTGVTSPSPGGPTPSPVGPPGPLDDWWIYVLIALGLFAGYQTWKWLTTPRPTFHPRLDPGVSEVGADKPLAVDLQVELNPDIASGEYGLETNEPSIIKSERKSND